MKVRHVAPHKDQFEDTEFYTDDGKDNWWIWKQLLTMANKPEEFLLPTSCSIPKPLADAMGSIYGLSSALAVLQANVPKKNRHRLGIDLAKDLLDALIEGREHPALRYWKELRKELQLKGLKGASALPAELIVRTGIVAISHVLADRIDPETGRKRSKGAARVLIARKLKALPQPFKDISQKQIENWETSQIAKPLSPDSKRLAGAQRVIADQIMRRRKDDNLDLRSDAELLEMAILYAARLISPVQGEILVDGDPFFQGDS